MTGPQCSLQPSNPVTRVHHRIPIYSSAGGQRLSWGFALCLEEGLGEFFFPLPPIKMLFFSFLLNLRTLILAALYSSPFRMEVWPTDHFSFLFFFLNLRNPWNTEE